MDLNELDQRLERIQKMGADSDVSNKLAGLREDIQEEIEAIGGDEINMLSEHGGVVHDKVWCFKILPSKDRVEIHTADRDEPHQEDLENFLEAYDKKIEIINHDYLKKICDENANMGNPELPLEESDEE